MGSLLILIAVSGALPGQKRFILHFSQYYFPIPRPLIEELRGHLTKHALANFDVQSNFLRAQAQAKATWLLLKLDTFCNHRNYQGTFEYQRDGDFRSWLFIVHYELFFPIGDHCLR